MGNQTQKFLVHLYSTLRLQGMQICIREPPHTRIGLLLSFLFFGVQTKKNYSFQEKEIIFWENMAHS